MNAAVGKVHVQQRAELFLLDRIGDHAGVKADVDLAAALPTLAGVRPADRIRDRRASVLLAPGGRRHGTGQRRSGVVDAAGLPVRFLERPQQLVDPVRRAGVAVTFDVDRLVDESDQLQDFAKRLRWARSVSVFHMIFLPPDTKSAERDEVKD